MQPALRWQPMSCMHARIGAHVYDNSIAPAHRRLPDFTMAKSTIAIHSNLEHDARADREGYGRAETAVLDNTDPMRSNNKTH